MIDFEDIKDMIEDLGDNLSELFDANDTRESDALSSVDSLTSSVHYDCLDSFDNGTDFDDSYIDDCQDYNSSEIASIDGYNVSFGAQRETISSLGGIEKSVTITKEPGSSNLFCITDGHTTIHNVKGGTSTIRIDNVKYKLPKLKG